MSRRRTLRIPVPWGHQPHTPPDDPFSVLVSERLDREDCLSGFGRQPRRPCLLGARSECAWGVQDRRACYCMWEWIRQNPEGPETQPKMAAALGQSRERVRALCDQGAARLRTMSPTLPQLL